MKTITSAANDIPFFARTMDDGGYYTSEQVFKAGVEFAQRWIPISDELPEYYKPFIGIFIIEKIEWPLSVWRAWSELSESDIYTITGTNNITDGAPIKWRPINIK